MSAIETAGRRAETPASDTVRPTDRADASSGRSDVSPDRSDSASNQAPVRGRSWAGELFRNLMPLLILVASGGGFVILKNLRSPEPARPQPPAYALVSTEALREHEGGFEIELDGLVVPHREISLSAEVPGRIVFKSPECRAGHFVQAPDNGTPGEPLLRIDNQDYLLEVDRLTAQLDQAKAALNELEEDKRGTASLLELARKDVELKQRELNRELSLADVNAPSAVERAEQEVLAARNAMVRLQNQIGVLNSREESLRASIHLAEVQLTKAELDLRRTVVYAPTDGMIVREMVEQDHYVQKGTPLLVIEDTSRAEVRCNLRLEQMYWLWLGENGRSAGTLPRDIEADYELPSAKAQVLYRLAGRDYVWDARLDRYDGIGLDEQTRTIPCRLVVEDPRAVREVNADQDAPPSAGPPALLRGMFVTVRIQVDPQPEPGQQLFRVPEQALRPGKRLWLDRQGILASVPVRFIRLLPREQAADSTAVEPAGQDAGSADDSALRAEPEPDFDALVQLDTSLLQPGDRLITSQLPDGQPGKTVLRDVRELAAADGGSEFERGTAEERTP